MQIYKFPNDYENDLRIKANASINETNTHFDKRRNTLISRISKPQKISEHVIISGFVGFIIGFILGFRSCCGPSASASRFFGTIFLVTAIFAIIGAIVGVIKKKNCEQNEQSIQSQIDQEREQTRNTINNINEQMKRECAQYKAAFEAEAQKMSTQYAQSALVGEVASFLLSQLVTEINCADRRSCIKEVGVNFVFEVHTYKIAYQKSVYNFKDNRCQNLSSPLQQTAIARAIASAIQYNVTKRYPKDASGTKYVLNTGYSYNADYVIVSIEYRATNGNYRNERSW